MPPNASDCSAASGRTPAHSRTRSQGRLSPAAMYSASAHAAYCASVERIPRTNVTLVTSAVLFAANSPRYHPDRHRRERDDHQRQKLSAMHRAGPRASGNVRVVAQKSDDGFRDEVVADEQRAICGDGHHQRAPDEVVERYSDQPCRKGARVVHEYIARIPNARPMSSEIGTIGSNTSRSPVMSRTTTGRRVEQEQGKPQCRVRGRVHRADRKRREKDESEHKGGRCTSERSPHFRILTPRRPPIRCGRGSGSRARGSIGRCIRDRAAPIRRNQ